MTDRKKKARLRNLKLNELSLVDRGANPGARIVLAKRYDPDDDRPALREDDPIRKDHPAMNDFSATVDTLEQRGLSPLDAYRKAARDNPGAMARLNAEGIAKAEAAARPTVTKRVITKAERDFDDRVAEIAKRDSVPAYIASRRARERYPDAWRAAFAN